MTEIQALGAPLPYIPDDLTFAQFILDHHHTIRPIRTEAKPWFIEDGTGRRIGFEELRSRTFGLANALSFKYNIKEDDVVCIYSSNHVDYPVAIWACHRLGAVVSCANPLYTADELRYQISETRTSLLLVETTSLPTALEAAKLTSIPRERIVVFDLGHSSDHLSIPELVDQGLKEDAKFVERRLKPGEAKTKLAFLNFSSGTTGRPKAIGIQHYAPIANVIQIAMQDHRAPVEQKRFMPGDVSIAVLPFYHIYGLIVNLHFMLFRGLTVVIVPKFNFEEMLKSIVKYRITHLCLVPPQVVLLCKHPATHKYNLNHIKWIMAGAAPISAELTKQLIERLPKCRIGQGFGMTETSTLITLYPPHQKIGTLGSAGVLLPGVTAKVIRDDGSLAKFGEQGELWLKSPSNALRYVNDAEATKETFVDGWVRTGDEVIIDENQELYVIDRLKEFLKVRGFQVAPAELEGHLLDHPSVADVCVVGVLDEFNGEVPLAFVLLDAQSAKVVERDSGEGEKIKASIMKHVADHKIQYKHLAGGVEFVDVIPKTPSGKLLRRLLRDKARQLRGSGLKAKL